MRAKIEKLEAAAVGEKPWQLKGEVGGKARPLNSLLETTLEFDQAGRPPPAVTEEATRGIDDIIRQRVKDGLWDDPVRKAALAPSAHRPKRVEISQEKSKLGLADEYAQQYEREVLGHKASDELAPKHAEVRKVFAKLVAKLDQLTSFQYAPKPHKTEMEVRANTGALALEEKTPLAVATGGAALAPEEVHAAPKRGGVANAELSQAERKAQRGKRKRVHKRRSGEREEQSALRATLDPDGATARRREGEKVERELADAKRRGRVKAEPLDKKARAYGGGGGGGGVSAAQGGGYTKSSQFFKTLEKQKEGPAAGGGGKRARGAAGGEEARRSVKFKL